MDLVAESNELAQRSCQCADLVSTRQEEEYCKPRTSRLVAGKRRRVLFVDK